MAAGGYVSPEAEAALSEVLRREPSNGRARYYTGLLYAQTGRPDLAFRVWRPLLEDSGRGCALGAPDPRPDRRAGADGGRRLPAAPGHRGPAPVPPIWLPLPTCPPRSVRR